MRKTILLFTLLLSAMNMMGQAVKFEKVIVSGIFENAVPPTIVTDKGEPCEIFFISTDGDDNNVERVILKFVNKHSKRMNINGQSKLMNYDYTTEIYADTLVLCHETRKYKRKPDVRSDSYYVYGDCTYRRSNYYNDKGEILEKDNFIKKYKGKVEISSDLYSYLKEAMEDDIKYKIISEEIDGDLETDVLIYGLPF